MTTSPTTPATTDEDVVYTVPEVAGRLKISQWTVHRLIRERALASMTIGARRLIHATDLEEYLRGLRNAEKGVRYGS